MWPWQDLGDGRVCMAASEGRSQSEGSQLSCRGPQHQSHWAVTVVFNWAEVLTRGLAMGFLAVRTVINVDVWRLFLLDPHTAETGGADQGHSHGQSPCPPSIRKFTSSSCSLLGTETCVGPWSSEREGRKGCRAALLKHESAVAPTTGADASLSEGPVLHHSPCTPASGRTASIITLEGKECLEAGGTALSSSS